MQTKPVTIAEFLTPFMFMALLGVMMIVEGLLHMGRENNALQFIFGVPVLFGALGAHWVVWRASLRNIRTMWIVEGVLVAVSWYLFFYVF